MSSDTIRLATGKVMTRSRAVALGLLDDDGNLLPDKDLDSQARRLVERDRQRAEWAKQQGLPAPASRRAAQGDDPKTTADGRLIPQKPIQPLRPANVTASGEPITDEALLAAIAAQTEAIETAKVSGVELTPAEKRALTKAVNAARAAAEAKAAEAKAAEEAEKAEGNDDLQGDALDAAIVAAGGVENPEDGSDEDGA